MKFYLKLNKKDINGLYDACKQLFYLAVNNDSLQVKTTEDIALVADVYNLQELLFSLSTRKVNNVDKRPLASIRLPFNINHLTGVVNLRKKWGSGQYEQIILSQFIVNATKKIQEAQWKQL